jgi:anthranilate synthase/aminodeoxychorismate synthase-like glutamine amidotransferase
MILLIDNYDSFTYNLFQFISELGHECRVVRNDAIDLAGIERLSPEAIVISPGPGNPDQAGISLDVIRVLGPKIPILGVCLGHQAIGQAFGAKVVRARKLMHGKTSQIVHHKRGLYAGVSSPMQVARYHSLVVSHEGLPSCLQVTARDDKGTIMGLRHKKYRIEGVQFHPESMLTPRGMDLLRNFFGQIGLAKVA